MRVVAVALLALAPPGLADRLELREVFDRTAAAPPVRYALGRDVLFAAGDRAVRLATARADDPDPRARALARLIRLRHEQPELVAVWHEALRGPRPEVAREESTYARATVRFRRVGSKGQHLEWREVLFPPASVPVVIDALRSGGLPTAAKVAGAMRAAETVPFLVERLGHDAAPYEDALVAIGPAAAPAVRPLLDEDNPFRVASAAAVLGRLADRASADALLRIARDSDDDYAFPAAAAALRTVDPARGAAILLDRLLARRSYVAARDALLPFGAPLAAAIAGRRGNADAVATAILDGIAWETADPDRAAAAYATIDPRDARWPPGMHEPAELGRITFWMWGAEGPAPLRVERTAAFGEPDDLLWLLDRDPPRGAAIARLVLTGDVRRHGYEPVLAALATVRPATALDAAESLLDDEPPPAAERYVAVLLLLLDEPRTARLLEQVAARATSPRYAQAVPVAAAALAVAGGEKTMADLLGDEREDIALAAARALARRGDPAGVPLLAAAAASARDFTYAALRDDLVRSGRPPSDGGDVVRRVLRAAVAFRIAAPARAGAIDTALARAQPRVFHILGPQPGHYEHAGHALADALGARARPLLEEAALFRGELVAIHALGRLADDGSIAVLLHVARTLPGPAARALRAMGDKGAAAARAVPPPDPGKAAYSARATRHAAAADALAGEHGGIEKVLEGLAERSPDEDRDGWARRMAGYLSAGLRAAGEGPPDPRLLEPALRLLDAHGRDHERMRDLCLDVLARFRGERVARAALPWLPAGGFGRDGTRALRVLRGALGDRAIAFVVGRAREEPADRFLHTLWILVRPPDVGRADKDACAALLRDACARGRAQAADDLFLLHLGRREEEKDGRDLEAVLAYVASSPKPGVVVHRLGEAKPPGAGAALLRSYRSGQDHRVLAALGAIGYEPAAQDVLRAARRWSATPRRGQWAGEVRTLARLGAAGREAVREFLDVTHDIRVRVAAAGALAAVRDPVAFDAIVALFDELERADSKEARKRLERLVWAAAGAAPDRALPELVRRAVVAPEPLRDLYADAAATIRSRHPDLAGSLPAVDGC